MAESNSALPLFSPQWAARNSHTTSEQHDQEERDRVNMQLYDMFVDCIDPCVIQEVAVLRNWNINEAINDLVTLTSSDCSKQDSPQQCLSESPNQRMAAQSPLVNSKGTRKNGKKKSNLETVSNRAGSSLTDFPDLIDLNPQPKLSEVKISYNQELGDDDDADVIIVKGNEFLPLSMDEKTFLSQSSPVSAATSTSARPQCFVQLMPPELLKSNKPVETKTVKKVNIQKEKQKKISPAKIEVASVRREYVLIKRQPDSIKRVILLIQNDIKVMVLMRGCPGSGKTYLSKLLLQKAKIKPELYSKFIFSADNYFYRRGVYVFNPEYLREAHASTQKCVMSAAAESRNPIIIDNTNTQMWEMKNYASIGVKYGYDLEILEPNTPWAFKEKELAKKNVHDVPKSKIRNMLERYECHITPAKLLSQMSLQYSPGNEPPQLATKKPVKQAKSGKKKKCTKKTEKSGATETVQKSDSSLFRPSWLTENVKSDTKKSLDYTSILDVNAVPELITLIENINKQWEDIGGTSSNDKVNNNENIISEGATNYPFVYNRFDKEEASSSRYKEDTLSSGDNQSSSESESFISIDNVQNTAIVTNETSRFVSSNYERNFINGSSDFILFADGNNIPNKNESREENLLNNSDSESAFDDTLCYDFLKKSACADDDRTLLETCDLSTCDKTENMNVLCSKYSFNTEALSKHVHSIENISYNNNSLVEYKRCVNAAKLMMENNTLPNDDETDNIRKLSTTYSFTAETLAEHIHAVQDSDHCNVLVQYKSNPIDLINLWKHHHPGNENSAENRSIMLTTYADNSQSFYDTPIENPLLDFVLINNSVHTDQSCVIETENNLSLVQDIVTKESERKWECLSFNQEKQKQDIVLKEKSSLNQTEIVDKTACTAKDLTSEEFEHQNRNVELVENVCTQNSNSSEIDLINKGVHFFENKIVQIGDCNSFNVDINKIVNTDENQNESHMSNDEIVTVNENLLETKHESYNDKHINVDDKASNIAVQKMDCLCFNILNENTCGDLYKSCNESQKNNEDVYNSNSDCMSFNVKSHYCKENGNAIELEGNQSVNGGNSEGTVENDRFLLNTDCTFENKKPGTSDVCINNNSIHEESIKNNKNEENCLNVNDNTTSNECKVTLVQYLLNKLKNNDQNNDDSTIDISNKSQPELLPNLSSSTDKDSYETTAEDLLDPILNVSPIQNFDLLAYLFDKNGKKGAVNITTDKSIDECQEEYNERLHITSENEHERKNGAAIEDSVLEDWEKQGGSWDESNAKEIDWDESNAKEIEDNVGTEVDATIPKPARNGTKFRTRNICGSPINLNNISDSCDWDTIDNPSFNWNSADAVQKIENNIEVKPQEQRESKLKPFAVEQSTNTCYTDFNLLHHDDLNETIKEKILFSKNRNICDGKNPNTNVYKPNFLSFDKSTMTGDDLSFETKLKYDFQQIVEMFPETELSSLMELVDKCGGNLDWAADVLTDSERNPELTIDNLFHNTSDIPLTTCDVFKASSFVQPDEPPVDVLVLDAPSQSVRLKKSMKQEKKSVSDSQLELKKLIESTFVLDKSHYSEHVWKIKKKKSGDYTKKDNGSDKEDDFYTYLQEPENSDFLNIKNDIEVERRECEENCEEVKIENVEDTLDDDLQGEGASTTTEEGGEGSSSTSTTTEEGGEGSTSTTEEEEEEEEEELVSDAEAEDEEGTLKLTLDWSLIMQLQKTFGNPLPDMKDLRPEVELPLSLACQLHSYIVESLIRQVEQQQEAIDQMIAEDNAFAWQLQQQEEEKASTSAQQPVPQLQEIMDMEMALALYRADQEEWKQQSQDSMANILSKKLLLEKFPHVDCKVLMEMFHAHNCSLHDTVATLSMSLSVDEPGLMQREMELLANAKEETIKIQKSKQTTLFTYVPNHGSSRHVLALKEEAGNMRTQASRYYELRKACFTKAQNMYKSGNRSVASYYSHLAGLYKEKIELCNSQAAAYLLYARTNSRTLDLHFLHVPEAQEVLKLFLDESIAQLREKQKSREILYVITGRGLHSADGVSKIKEMVKNKLRKRKIKFSEANPGMLRAVITKNTQLGSN